MERPPIGEHTVDGSAMGPAGAKAAELRLSGVELTASASSFPSASRLSEDATLMDESVAGSPAVGDDSVVLPAGTQIGHYFVLERLGAGAMGVVYSAFDPRLDRRVAIKLLRASRRRKDTEASHSRLLREAQALAKLKDPHVVVVHDVGRYEEQVFVAMEFVDGPTLKQWLAEERSVQEVLSVFVRAGEGLAAAHRAGLVHRDFKPENVMIDARGRPRVMDFGLARSADDEENESSAERSGLSDLSLASDALATPLTQTGAVLGTPAYMAPEQHLGLAADARSDQFAFCVALYEGLYGVRPFAGNTVAQIGLAVTSGEIRETPRERGVPGWIRAVLHRGLSVDAGARYTDMDELLAALRDDPQLKRRRSLAAFGGVAIVAASTAALLTARTAERPCEGSADQLAQVWSAERAASLRKAFAATERSYADSAADHVIAAVDDFSKSWVDLHRDACEATHIRKERSVELMDRQMLCLDRSRTAFSELLEVFTQADGAAVDQAVAAVEALPDLAGCGDLERVLSGVQPPAAKIADEVDALRDLLATASARRATGSPEPALEVLAEASPRVDAVDYLPLKAEFQLESGLSHLLAGKYEDSARALEEAHVLGVTTNYERVATQAAAELIYVAGYRLARHQAADTWMVTARAWAERVDPDGPLTAHVMHNTGVLHDAAGRDEEARPAYEKALAIRRATYGERHRLVAKSTHNLGNVFLSAGDYDEAAAHYARARDIYTEVLGAGHPEIAGSLNNLGLAYRQAGDYEPSIVALREANAIYERTLGPKHPDIGLSLDNLAITLVRAGEPKEARVLANRSLQVRLDALGDSHPDVADTRMTLAEVALVEGKDAEAVGEATLAVDSYLEAFGDSHPQLALALDLRGRVHLAAGRYERAAQDLTRASTIQTEHVFSKHERARTLGWLSKAHAGMGQTQESESTHKQALQLFAEAGPAYADEAAQLAREAAAAP